MADRVVEAKDAWEEVTMVVEDRGTEDRPARKAAEGQPERCHCRSQLLGQKCAEAVVARQHLQERMIHFWQRRWEVADVEMAVMLKAVALEEVGGVVR